MDTNFSNYDILSISYDRFRNDFILCYMKKIFIPNYKDWFGIIKQDGNRFLIDFYGKKICYNILGIEGIEII